MPLVKPSLPPRASSSVDQPEQPSPTFGPCPRTNFVSGVTNWFHITTPKPFPDVDICEDCYNTSFRNTRYGRCISQSPPKPTDLATRCDFSDNWNRIAYLWLWSQESPDLTLLGSTASVPHDEVCPNLNLQDPAADVQKPGKPSATRTWYCLPDPSTGLLIEDLTVCSDCVARINHIFPCLDRIFQPVANGQKLEATCDLITARDSSTREQEYVSQIFDTALETLKTRTRDLRPLADFLKKWAPIPTCSKGQNTPPGTRSYTFPKSMPYYAACEECYTKHVLPLLESGSPPVILKEMSPTVCPNGFVCDLYSPRLLQYFRDACSSYNIETYKQRILARETKMQEYNVKLEQMALQLQQFNRQSRIYQMQMQSARSQETVRSMQWNSSVYRAPPVSSASAKSPGRSRAVREHCANSSIARLQPLDCCYESESSGADAGGDGRGEHGNVEERVAQFVGVVVDDSRLRQLVVWYIERHASLSILCEILRLLIS